MALHENRRYVEDALSDASAHIENRMTVVTEESVEWEIVVVGVALIEAVVRVWGTTEEDAYHNLDPDLVLTEATLERMGKYAPVSIQRVDR